MAARWFTAPGTLGGGFYRSLEWLLKWRTDLFLFESSYVAGLFRAEIGRPPALVRVVHNGVGDAEFAPIAPRPTRPISSALGELRPVKAFDVLIEAVGDAQAHGRRVSATIAGEGPHEREAQGARRSASASPIRSASSAIVRRARHSPWGA